MVETLMVETLMVETVEVLVDGVGMVVVADTEINVTPVSKVMLGSVSIASGVVQTIIELMPVQGIMLVMGTATPVVMGTEMPVVMGMARVRGAARDCT